MLLFKCYYFTVKQRMNRYERVELILVNFFASIILVKDKTNSRCAYVGKV